MSGYSKDTKTRRTTPGHFYFYASKRLVAKLTVEVADFVGSATEVAVIVSVPPFGGEAGAV